MSLDFKLHYDRLREGDPTKPEATATSEEGIFYDGPSYVRNLCLVWPNGRRQFLNYAYLIGGTFTLGEEMNEINLNFSTCTITLEGYGLESLFIRLLDQIPKQIMQAEQRYVKNGDSIVTKISIELVK